MPLTPRRCHPPPWASLLPGTEQAANKDTGGDSCSGSRDPASSCGPDWTKPFPLGPGAVATLRVPASFLIGASGPHDPVLASGKWLEVDCQAQTWPVKTPMPSAPRLPLSPFFSAGQTQRTQQGTPRLGVETSPQEPLAGAKPRGPGKVLGLLISVSTSISGVRGPSL